MNLKKDKEEENNEQEEEKEKKEINLTKEEEECINEYEIFLKKVLKAFNILYLCKTKQEFLNIMKEKGINQQIDNKSSINKSLRGKGKRMTKRKNKTERHIIKADADENKNKEIIVTSDDKENNSDNDYSIEGEIDKKNKKNGKKDLNELIMKKKKKKKNIVKLKNIKL